MRECYSLLLSLFIRIFVSFCCLFFLLFLYNIYQFKLMSLRHLVSHVGASSFVTSDWFNNFNPNTLLWSSGPNLLPVHDMIAKAPELGSLKGFCKKVTKHGAGRAMLHQHILCTNTVCHEEISDIQMTGTTSTRSSSIFGKENSAEVVLIDTSRICLVSLTAQEVLCP